MNLNRSKRRRGVTEAGTPLRVPLKSPGAGREFLRPQAFTLVELVAVLALLAVLACLMRSAFAKTGPNSQSAQCLHNLRRLGMAWKMYAEDNSARLAPNRDGGATGSSASDASWAGGWLDYSASTANTNTALLLDHDRYPYSAYLGPYLQIPAVFKCPADTSVVRIAGRMWPRARSYSMSGLVGELSRAWSGSGTFQVYRKLTDIANPIPANLMVILDEREDSINDGAFMLDPDTPWQMIDFPGGFHNGGCNFVFADGHAETHKWQDPRTIPRLRPGALLPLNVSIVNDADVVWIHEHATARH